MLLDFYFFVDINTYIYMHTYMSLPLVHISEVGILLVREVLKSMHKRLIMRFPHTLCSQTISLLVLSHQIPAEQYYVNDEEGVASQVRGKCNEVPWGVPGEKDLRPW